MDDSGRMSWGTRAWLSVVGATALGGAWALEWCKNADGAGVVAFAAAGGVALLLGAIGRAPKTIEWGDKKLDLTRHDQELVERAFLESSPALVEKAQREGSQEISSLASSANRTRAGLLGWAAAIAEKRGCTVELRGRYIEGNAVAPMGPVAIEDPGLSEVVVRDANKTARVIMGPYEPRLTGEPRGAGQNTVVLGPDRIAVRTDGYSDNRGGYTKLGGDLTEDDLWQALQIALQNSLL